MAAIEYTIYVLPNNTVTGDYFTAEKAWARERQLRENALYTAPPSSTNFTIAKSRGIND